MVGERAAGRASGHRDDRTELAGSATDEEIDVTKSGLAAVLLMIVGFGASACGAGPCAALIDKQKACCDNAADKEACLTAVEDVNLANIDSEACDAAAAAYTCPTN